LLNIFPLTQQAFNQFLETIDENRADDESKKKLEHGDLTLEPSDEECKKYLQKMIIQQITYDTILQNKTGELASRMIAMKNATDNSNSLIKSLTLSFNKARQGIITQEISEIVSATISMQ